MSVIYKIKHGARQQNAAAAALRIGRWSLQLIVNRAELHGRIVGEAMHRFGFEFFFVVHLSLKQQIMHSTSLALHKIKQYCSGCVFILDRNILNFHEAVKTILLILFVLYFMQNQKGSLPQHISINPEEQHASPSKPLIREEGAQSPSPNTKCDVEPSASCPIIPQFIYSKQQKVIPGYNFQSLFRKKSHIRLARKKNKEENEKRSSNIKLQSLQKEEKNIQKGHWTQEENKLYHWFLEIHNRHFILKYLRRTDKIFKNMASFISTREAEQCRSHHQKMEKKYLTFYQILLKLRMDFYSTANPDELKADLQQNGFKLKDTTILLSEEDLRIGNSSKREKKKQSNEQESPNDSLDDSFSEKSQNNLLNEDYENNLEFHIHLN